MLAIVKEPHIRMEFDKTVPEVQAFLEYITDRYTVEELPESEADDDEEYVNIRDTDFWREMNTPGHLLAGYRLKHDMTRAELAKRCGMSYATISAYEHDRRKITPLAARRLAVAMGEDPDVFLMYLQDTNNK